MDLRNNLRQKKIFWDWKQKFYNLVTQNPQNSWWCIQVNSDFYGVSVYWAVSLQSCDCISFMVHLTNLPSLIEHDGNYEKN